MRRRSFLGGIAGGLLSSLAAHARTWSAGPRYDLIVVGAGSAGIPAGIFAAKRGAKVLMLEAAPVPGGTLFLSTGQMSAAGTQLQQQRGIQDSADLHYDDVMRISRNTADPELVRLAVDEAAATFDWLMELGFSPLPEHPVLGQAHEPYSRKRYAWGENGGRDVLAALRTELNPLIEPKQITLLTESPVTALLTNESGAVIGVRTRSKDRERNFFATSTLLTSGGYAGNPELFEKLSGYRHYASMSYPFCRGAGIELAVAVGGYVRGRENYLSNFGSILDSNEFPAPRTARFDTNPVQRPPWEIYVNVHGERFVNEDEPSVDIREHSLLDQPDLRYWIVFDEAILAEAPPGVIGWTRDSVRKAFEEHPMFYRASSVDELAALTGIDAAGLQQTIVTFNQSDSTDPLGRSHRPRAIEKPPFYAIRMQGHSVTSTVGIAVDRELRVIRPDGTPIGNLYAAGELLGSGQTMGSAFVGGMMLTPALSLGRYLGQRLQLPAG